MGELVDKFSLEEHEREDFLFGEFVVPVYDIGAHVANWESIEKRIAISADGPRTFFTIPEDAEWKIRRVDVIHEAGANFDIDQVFFYESTTKHQYLFYNTAAPITSGTVNLFELPQDITMKRNMLSTIEINVSNFVAGGYVSLNVLREVTVVR